MFSKAFRTKSSCQMKGSDKKKFKSDLAKKFPGISKAPPDTLNQLLPNKEEVTVSKIETFAGESVFLYLRAKEVLFFELEKDKVVYPTLYTLWKCPELLSCFTTHPNVVDKLANGADLMLPGVVVDERLGLKAYHLEGGHVHKHDVVGVNLTNNKACVAIGLAHLSSEDMYMSGRRGKAVRILHCYGDQLWQSGSQQKLPDLGPPEGLGFLTEPTNDTDQEGEVGQEQDLSEKALEDMEELTVEETGVEEVSADTEDGHGVDFGEVEHVDEVSAPEGVDMDTLLENAFLRACKTTGKKAELPILTSSFYRAHVVPACPPDSPDLDLKKTRFKKLSKFLAEKQAQGLITVKEQKKGIETITAINQEHEAVQQFRVVKYQVPENQSGKANGERGPPVITELNIVSGNEVLGFFKSLKVPKGTGLTTQEVRECVRTYVGDNGLQHAQDKAIVNLDPVLADAVLVKGENNVVTFRWDKLHSRICNKMSKGYSIQIDSGPPTVHKGKLDLIEMIVASRSGNKKVTLVHNLDVFGIDPSEFAHKCQVGVAASTTVGEAGNKKKSGGAPVIEVLVQGNQIIFVSKLLLDHYKIARKYIRGLDLAPKNNKGKKKK